MNYVKSLAKQLGAQGRPREWSCPNAALDALAGERWSDAGEAETFGSQTPLGRPGQLIELASIYVQLAANASYANGNIHGSSGGTGQP